MATSQIPAAKHQYQAGSRRRADYADGFYRSASESERLFRTTDTGTGALFFELPTSPYPNVNANVSFSM
jgi:hypothetical protein